MSPTSDKEKLRNSLTLKNLRRHDDKVVSIVAQSPHAVVYTSSNDANGDDQWVSLRGHSLVADPLSLACDRSSRPSRAPCFCSRGATPPRSELGVGPARSSHVTLSRRAGHRLPSTAS